MVQLNKYDFIDILKVLIFKRYFKNCACESVICGSGISYI